MHGTNCVGAVQFSHCMTPCRRRTALYLRSPRRRCHWCCGPAACMLWPCGMHAIVRSYERPHALGAEPVDGHMPPAKHPCCEIPIKPLAGALIRLVVPVLRSCQSPIRIWLVNYLHLHLHLLVHSFEPMHCCHIPRPASFRTLCHSSQPHVSMS